MTGWNGRLFLDAGTVLYLGSGGEADAHAHHSVQLVWAREGSFTVRVAGTPAQARAVLIAAGVEHAFDASGTTIALVLVEPHGPRGAALDRRARSAAGEDLAEHLPPLPFPSLDASAAEAWRWCDAVLAALGGSPPSAMMSSVSRRAVEYVESAIEGKPRLAEAAARAGVSSTRLTHLFTREVGVPFRRFVLWTRIKRAVEATRAGADLSAAAAAAGFSDAAHLSRTFRQTFGLSPSRFLPFVDVTGSPWGSR